MTYLAVFHDGGGGWKAKFLRPGFRHVFTAVTIGDYWVTLDGKDGLPLLAVVAPSHFDLKAFYEREGYTVLELKGKRNPTRFPVMSATCIGAAKKMLGINKPFIQTPYGLFRYLEKQNA